MSEPCTSREQRSSDEQLGSGRSASSDTIRDALSTEARITIDKHTHTHMCTHRHTRTHMCTYTHTHTTTSRAAAMPADAATVCSRHLVSVCNLSLMEWIQGPGNNSSFPLPHWKSVSS